MADQAAFQFSALPGEALPLGRMGLELDWRKVDRVARRQLAAASVPAGFDALRYFRESALIEEIQRRLQVQAREVRRGLAGRLKKPAALVAIAKTPEGRRAQLVIDRLVDRLEKFERARLCG